MDKRYVEIVKTFIVENTTITVMESCTGGLVQSMITDVEGVSAIFKGGLVTYSNEAKISAGVPAETIEKYGVYSAECAEAMAKTVKRLYNADIAIGVTGSTGNVDPNNPDSIVGEVYYCIVRGNEVKSYHYTTNVDSKSRAEIKQEYAMKIFEALAE